MSNSLGKNWTLLHESCTTGLARNDLAPSIDLSFLDPPFNQDKTYIVAEQLGRKSIGIELDSHNVTLIQNRLTERRDSDNVSRFFKDYAYTLDLEVIWVRKTVNVF